MPQPRLDLDNLRADYDKQGREILDPTPLEPPLGYRRQPSLTEQIRAMVRSEALRQAAAEAGLETFEEADDYDIGDDAPEPYEANAQQYEAEFEPLSAVKARKEVIEAEEKAVEAAKLAAQQNSLGAGAAAGVTKDPLPSDPAKKP